MVQEVPRTLAPIDPTVLGDPAAVEEIHLLVLSEAATLDDVDPQEGALEAAVSALM